MNVYRKILHFEDTKSDKVYIVEVNKVEAATNPYVVSTAWAKRTALTFSQQIKNKFSSEYTAISYAERLVRKKKAGRDAYQDADKNISIPHYEMDGVTISDVANAAKKTAKYEVVTEDVRTAFRRVNL